MRAQIPVCMVALALVAVSCSGDDAASSGTADGCKPTSADFNQDGDAQSPAAERVSVEDQSALDAGPGDEKHWIAGAASNGDTLLAAGAISEELREDGPTPREPVLLSSPDGRSWERVDLAESVPDGAFFHDVVSVNDELVVIGSLEDGTSAAVWTFADGSLDGPREITFGDDIGDVAPVGAVAVCSELFVVGAAYSPDSEGQNPRPISFTMSVSDDHGETWSALDVPDQLKNLKNDAGFPLSGFATWPVLAPLEASGEFILATNPTFSDSVVGALLRFDAESESWTDLGTTADAFADDVDTLNRVQVTHLQPHGEDLIAIAGTGAPGVWRSADSGASFERFEFDVPEGNADAYHFVRAGESLADGTLILAGSISGESRGVQTAADLQVWASRDMADWQRAAEQQGQPDDGMVNVHEVVVHNGEAVVIGTHERKATAEEIEKHEERLDNEESAPLGILGTDAAVWIVSFEA